MLSPKIKGETKTKSKRRREQPKAGSIEERLSSMYPGHWRLQTAIADLSRSSIADLSDLENVPSRQIEGLVPTLFLIALRDKLADSVPQLVELDVTANDMILNFTERSVTLREANAIPQLEVAYDPMCENEEADLSGEPCEVDEKEAEIEDDEEEEEEEEEEEDNTNTSEANFVFERQRKELITLKMYEVTKGCEFLRSVWGRNGHEKLLERSHYRKLLVRVQKMWDDEATALMLTGTPGIGKSAFLLYMLMVLLSDYKPVVFRTKSNESYFFEPPYERMPSTSGIPAGYKCFLTHNNAILLDKSVYFLADGKLPDPPTFFGKALLASTPLKENAKEYKKDGRHDSLLLPVWSAAEIALAWQEIFDPALIQETVSEDDVSSNAIESLDEDAGDQKHDVSAGPKKQEQDARDLVPVQSGEMTRAKAELTLDVVKQRYMNWGGTPRYVLERPHEDLSKIIASVQSIQTIVEAAGKEIADADHPSHKIAHMKVKPGYQHYEYMFASPYVTQLARQKLKEDTSSNLRTFLSFKGMQAHMLNGLKGNIFQAEFMDVAIGRKKMNVRQVFKNIKKHSQDIAKVFDFNKTFRGLFRLEDVAASALPANRIIWPGSKIQATFDALKIVRRKGREDVLELYQVTLSSSRNQHGLKYEAVDAVMQQVGVPSSRTRVYTTTTSELYPEAGYQKWLGPGGRVLKDEVQLKRLAGIAQYVLDSGI